MPTPNCVLFKTYDSQTAPSRYQSQTNHAIDATPNSLLPRITHKFAISLSGELARQDISREMRVSALSGTERDARWGSFSRENYNACLVNDASEGTDHADWSWVSNALTVTNQKGKGRTWHYLGSCIAESACVYACEATRADYPLPPYLSHYRLIITYKL